MLNTYFQFSTYNFCYYKSPLTHIGQILDLENIRIRYTYFFFLIHELKIIPLGLFIFIISVLPIDFSFKQSFQSKRHLPKGIFIRLI